MASTIKQTADAATLARHDMADAIRDKAEAFESAVTLYMVRRLGGDSIWERAAKGGTIPLI